MAKIINIFTGEEIKQADYVCDDRTQLMQGVLTNQDLELINKQIEDITFEMSGKDPDTDRAWYEWANNRIMVLLKQLELYSFKRGSK